jgi:hypothetical protein
LILIAFFIPGNPLEGKNILYVQSKQKDKEKGVKIFPPLLLITILPDRLSGACFWNSVSGAVWLSL